ncbi:MFS transporter [Cryobacterium sp. W22_MBD10_FK3]|uniref:MFS transporter n=1 Tax=Cryobacterium sp. W22_MBD10_FK3 TaxID=3240273 RepID=UPI003F8FDBBC
MTITAAPPTVSARAWVVLALGVAAQTAGTVFVSAPAFLIPLLHTERGLSLAQAGLLAAIPTFGMVLTLILWGALADRIGEKWVIAGGLLLTALAAGGAILADGYLMLGLFLLLGGMASASTNSASGRIVVGWFPKHKRGLAMGIRQMSQPLGVTVAAVTIPVIAADAGVGAALLVPFALTAVLAVACALGLANPPRVATRAAAAGGAGGARAAGTTAARAHNPYRSSWFLWRIHAASVLLVVPQFTISTFGLVWLVSDQGWDALAAGVLVGAAQFVGALGRIVIGVVSDRVGSRVRPLRWVAVSVASVLLVLAAVDAAHWGVAAVVFVLATTCTVAPNGLAFTSVAEMAGPGWSGKALGVQNTGQFIAASLVGPLMGALIGVVGYPLTFAVAAVFPALAVPVVPRAHAEHDHL